MNVRIANILSALLAMFGMVAIVFLSHADQFSLFPYLGLIAFPSACIWMLMRDDAGLKPIHVFVLSFLLHTIAIFGVGNIEDDYYRFIWDGWRLWDSGTPYGIAPSEYFGDFSIDPKLQSVLDGINNPSLSTIYGPILQILFTINWMIFGSDPMGLRIIFALVNMFMIALMLRKYAPWQVARYAWAPFPIVELIIHIHPDGVMALLIMAALLLGISRPILLGILLGMAAGAKILALAIWPILLRANWRALLAAIATMMLLYVPFLAQGQDAGFGTTGIFAQDWLYNPLLFELLASISGQNIARMMVAILGIIAIIILHGRARNFDMVPVASIFAVIFFVAPAVNAWYLIWILPFAVGRRDIWPAAAMFALPLSYITGLNLGDDGLQAYEVHPYAWWAEVMILIAAFAFDIMRWRKQQTLAASQDKTALTPIRNPKISLVIPALNEEESVGQVISGFRMLQHNITVHLVDNGSTDNTAMVAKMAGATVISEPQKGYGAACLMGVSAIPDDTDIILFADADGSDNPQDALAILQPIIDGSTDIVIGSRNRGVIEKGAMTIPQRFGNILATQLLWLFWGKRMSDLGPFRAIRKDRYDMLQMADRDFGWTIEMQVKAAQKNMRMIEVPADYKKRIGKSKISGTIKGVIGAGGKILYIIAREAFSR